MGGVSQRGERERERGPPGRWLQDETFKVGSQITKTADSTACSTGTHNAMQQQQCSIISPV